MPHPLVALIGELRRLVGMLVVDDLCRVVGVGLGLVVLLRNPAAVDAITGMVMKVGECSVDTGRVAT
jgi:hypothetical protein